MFTHSPERQKPDPIDIHVGRRIRMRRLWIEMTQETLAKALGITFQQLQKYEKGTNRVGASRLQAIAKVLEVAPSYFSGTCRAVRTTSPPSRFRTMI